MAIGLVSVYLAIRLAILMAIGRWPRLWQTVLRLDIIDNLGFCVGLFCFSAVG